MSGKVFKIIHLSDIHIGFWKSQEKFATIIKNILKREKPKNTVIVITGDLVESMFGKKGKALIIARNMINILKRAGFKVLIAPGNHDYGSGLMHSVRKAKIFNKLFFHKSLKAFPHVDVIGDCLFVGLDSNAEELHWYDRFFADGEIGKKQIAKLKAIINKREYKDKYKIVYLHHNPVELFPFHLLKDSRRLKEAVANKIDIMLYGHNHLGHISNGKWGIRIMLDGGSSTGKRMFGMKPFHRVIEIPSMKIVKKNYLE